MGVAWPRAVRGLGRRLTNVRRATSRGASARSRSTSGRSREHGQRHHHRPWCRCVRSAREHGRAPREGVAMFGRRASRVPGGAPPRSRSASGRALGHRQASVSARRSEVRTWLVAAARPTCGERRIPSEAPARSRAQRRPAALRPPFTRSPRWRCDCRRSASVRTGERLHVR